jgi:hypothetical protein
MLRARPLARQIRMPAFAELDDEITAVPTPVPDVMIGRHPSAALGGVDLPPPSGAHGWRRICDRDRAVPVEQI